MGLRDLHLNLRRFRLKSLLTGNGRRNRRRPKISRTASWMKPLSHGHHIVKDLSLRNDSNEPEADSVVVQREQLEDEVHELWFFGVFDPRVGDGVTKYVRSHLFDGNRRGMSRRSKETMRKAYLGARAKIKETQKAEEKRTTGSVSVLVINMEKLVTASMGNYRAVVCRDGVAHEIGGRDQQSPKKFLSRRLLSARRLLDKVPATKQPKPLDLTFGDEKIGSSTEFVILASTGIWEVMNNQEAVQLISHIEDPGEAAECLAKEALVRRSRSSISCLVIRFD